MDARIGLSRRAAKNLLTKLNITAAPIRLSPIVKELKYNVSAGDLSDGLSGIQITISDDCFILYNKNHHVHRKRFTVAHEIGHHVLKHKVGDHQHNLTSKDNDEVEANQFAAELLMPLELLKREISNGNDTAKFLALRFWVSNEAMSWRLLETGLYKRLSSWV